MAKELRVNVYIYGEKGVGKTFLAKYIAPNAVVNPTAPTINPIIIENFDKNPVFNFKNSFLIATGTEPLNRDLLKRYFTMDIEIKPLKEHPEDIGEFIAFFTNEAQKELKIYKNISVSNPDISENLNSLKRQIYKLLLMPEKKEEILNMLFEHYLKEHMTYEEEINDFEKTLFKAMKNRYTSKLKISEKLKINRVTLTKKMKALDV